jgi:hypothetical protein
MMVEKAKKNRQIATKVMPKDPRPLSKAFWVRAMPVVEPSMELVTKMTKAVIFSTIKVSTKTPTMATKPCWAGYFTLATAWACGVEPMPASLENRPRATP